LNNPVTEPKRSQKPKRPLSIKSTAHRYNIYARSAEHPLGPFKSSRTCREGARRSVGTGLTWAEANFKLLHDVSS
jgi:hypothetical protein